MVFLSYILFAFQALQIHVLRKRLVYTLGTLIVLGLITLSAILFLPPAAFPQGIVEIDEEQSVAELAETLEQQKVIHSELAFRILARVTGADTSIKAGKYLFAEPVGLATVLMRLATGQSGIATLRVTFPEGITVREMGIILEERLPSFDTAAWTRIATSHEGYLFPDTYDFSMDATPEEITTRMRAQFDEVWVQVKEKGILDEPQSRIVILASLLEKETKVGPDRSLVSGILWKRINMGMALQVDAVFGYIKGMDTYHPSFEDLEIDSPYNTYENPDLPPTAIGNPGEDALRAALAPVKSKYLYYLSGNDGVMYYASSFEEHKQNRALYLD